MRCVCPQSLQGSVLSCASGHVTCCPLRPLAATTSPRKSAETNRRTSVASYHQTPQTVRSQGCTPFQVELPGAPGQTQACPRSLIPSELFSALWWVMTPLFSFCNFTVDLLWELAGDRPHVQSSFSWYHVLLVKAPRRVRATQASCPAPHCLKDLAGWCLNIRAAASPQVW